ncbi:2'-5' RNA ligase family protein [Saccharothrix obliqua]|uniref:2'-5' RNA ligase family protein n=1 Tax=Saccharothrix obliqua TaxID=2861747 RepID=UPI001C5CEEC6|nr:2'-5' RNA ligase family protein [Saccharothrix obliqua]MBW4720169.1 RNA 2',3'-cyclic phosphodiesterase [Saccharothrix obliqua]
MFPPDDVVAELAAALRPVRVARPDLRWSTPGRWHVTLCFHGDDAEPGGQLDAVRGLPAPAVRLAGSGAFPGVLWVGVEGPLRPLAVAAGATGAWRPHLTVARSRRRAERWPRVEFTGREWTVTEVALVRSRPGEGYEILDRVPLSTPNG